MFRLGAVAAIAALVFPGVATAASLQFSYNAGPIFAVGDFLALDNPAFDFTPGENIIIDVTIDDATPYVATDAAKGYYFDPAGTITATGSRSGNVIAFEPGVILEVENFNEFDVQSNLPGDPDFLLIPFPFCCDEIDPLLPEPATLTQGDFYLGGDTDYRSAVDFLTDPLDLTQVVLDITAHFPGGEGATPNLSSGSVAEALMVDGFFGPAQPGEVLDYDDAALLLAFAFGPVAAVPVPATLPLLLGAISILGWRARRRG